MSSYALKDNPFTKLEYLSPSQPMPRLRLAKPFKGGRFAGEGK
jgi:hypothetical protein